MVKQESVSICTLKEVENNHVHSIVEKKGLRMSKDKYWEDLENPLENLVKYFVQTKE